MWTVIYVTANEQIATRISRQLTEEGFLVKVRQNTFQQFELLVPEGELEEIQEVLTAYLPIIH